MLANAYRTYDSVVQSYVRVVSNQHITHGVVDATVGFDDAVAADGKTMEGRGVHSYAPIDKGAFSPMLIQRGQPPDVPSGAHSDRTHDDSVHDFLDSFIALDGFFYAAHSVCRR